MKGEKALQKLYRKSAMYVKRNSSTILTCVSAVGVVATTVTAVRATPKALMLLEEAREEKGEDLTKLEAVKVAGPVYIPSVVLGVSTIACIVSANVLNKRSQAAITSAYALLDNSYKEYKQKVEELYGEEANLNVKREIVKDKYENLDLEFEDEKLLFYDDFSQRYFESTEANVLRAEYNVNHKLITHSGLYLNDFYDHLGIERVSYGDYLGWSADQVYDTTWETWIHFDHDKVTMDDGLECYIITFNIEPCPDFDEW